MLSVAESFFQNQCHRFCLTLTYVISRGRLHLGPGWSALLVSASIGRFLLPRFSKQLALGSLKFSLRRVAPVLVLDESRGNVTA